MDFSCCKNFNFTEQCINAVCPADARGVYGIFRPDAWIYIGKGFLRAELLRYARGDNPRILAERPTAFCGITCSDYDCREKELICLYQPIVNCKVG